MTLTERTLVLACLGALRLYALLDEQDQRARIAAVDKAIEIMTHVEIKGPGLPVSAGGKDE
jgi:hypothetical protein